MTLEEQKQIAIDNYVNLMRIKACQTSENKELDRQLEIARIKLSTFSNRPVEAGSHVLKYVYRNEENIMSETFTGKVWTLGDDIDTDIIIPTEYLALKTVQDMAPYAFSPLRPELAAQIQPGDVIVAGKNFGCGSSREQAPEIIKALSVRCVIARSFARIFFRNAINNGLLLIENSDLRDAVTEGDTIEVCVGEKIVHKDREFPIASLPQNLMDILNAGGLVKAMRRLNGLEG